VKASNKRIKFTDDYHSEWLYHCFLSF
jgi:hypothetical protein